jgi:hypothetical protein
MTDLDPLVRVCKAIPGFCVRSQNLLGPARKAIIGAIRRSGQALPLAAQPYIGHSDNMESGSGQRVIDYPGSADEASQNSPAGLQMLAEAAANRVESSHRGSTSGVIQDQSTRDTQAQQAQQQLVAQNEGLTTGQLRASDPPEAAVVPTISYGQAVESPWQAYTEQIPQHDPVYGAQRPEQYGLDHTGMSVVEQTTPSGWYPAAAASPSSYQTVVPHLLQDNVLNDFYPSTVISGYSTNNEWEILEHDLFTRYGGCTTQF